MSTYLIGFVQLCSVFLHTLCPEINSSLDTKNPVVVVRPPQRVNGFIDYSRPSEAAVDGVGVNEDYPADSRVEESEGFVGCRFGG